MQVKPVCATSMHRSRISLALGSRGRLDLAIRSIESFHSSCPTRQQETGMSAEPERPSAVGFVAVRCKHCYMGERLERALKMPFDTIVQTLTTWRQMGGSKLTILGGEPTLHPRFSDAIRHATAVGYEHVITTSNGLGPAMRKFRRMTPEDFAYIQISLDGGSAISHDHVRGAGTFDQALRNVAELVERGFDTRIICTVNRINAGDCLTLLDIADEIGVSLVKFHVFSVIGPGHDAAEWGMQPLEWIEFYEKLERVAPGHRTRVWYQPTYARRDRIAGYAADGYRGCVGRTLDRISIFPDGRAYAQPVDPRIPPTGCPGRSLRRCGRNRCRHAGLSPDNARPLTR
jgi:MoaA/NifB/PqqE/SkfB family radical SAM enzyme